MHFPGLPRVKKPSLERLISLRGRRSPITGAAAGIGGATALRLAEAGSDLILVDVDAEGLEDVRGELSRYGVEVETHVADLSKREEIDGLWNELRGREPDVLVNSVGCTPSRSSWGWTRTS